MRTWALRNRWALFALLTYCVLIFGPLQETYVELRYLAPITGVNYIFAVQAMRLCRWRHRKIGQFMSWLVPFLAITAIVLSLGKAITHNSSDWHIQRAPLLKQLKHEEGQHLIIVNYGTVHSRYKEWVYNEANIDEAKVVWARQMDGVQDCELVQYFRLRHMIYGHWR